MAHMRPRLRPLKRPERTTNATMAPRSPTAGAAATSVHVQLLSRVLHEQEVFSGKGTTHVSAIIKNELCHVFVGHA